MTTRNAKKIRQLKEDVQWAATDWLEDCAKQGYPIRISEAYRTQSRQNRLFAKGRTTQGRIVTYARISNHTKKLALDVYRASGESTPEFYTAIEFVGKKYGITHPLTDAPLVDLPHFEFVNVSTRPIEPSPDKAKMIQKRLVRRLIERALNPKVFKRLMQRVNKRYPNLFIP